MLIDRLHVIPHRHRSDWNHVPVLLATKGVACTAKRRSKTAVIAYERYAPCFCVIGSPSGRILNQMEYMAGRKTKVMTVPPKVPPIRV